MSEWFLRKVITGGQTGVDRACLDVALELGVPCGGWCPKGRLAEDGVLDAKYPLVETDDAEYSERTRRNVKDADGLLVLYARHPGPGTRHAMNIAAELGHPAVTVDLTRDPEPEDVLKWLAKFKKGVVINVAGPRESTVPGIYQMAADYLRALLPSIPLEHRLDQLPRP